MVKLLKSVQKGNDYINPMEVNLDVIYHPEKYRINGDVEDIDTIIADKCRVYHIFLRGHYEETSKVQN